MKKKIARIEVGTECQEDSGLSLYIAKQYADIDEIEAWMEVPE